MKIDTEVVYNPIDLSNQSIHLEKYNTALNAFNIITVGRLIDVKNQRGIIESLNLLPPDFKLEIYGSGPLENDLILLSTQLELEKRIDFKGSVKNVLDHLEKGQCLVVFSNTEGFPNVILEAMSVGLPVISSNCMSGPLELLNENDPVNIKKEGFFEAKYGILVNVNDTVGLSNAIQFLQSNNNIREHYRKLGLERVKDYEVENIGREMNNIINKISL
ncbi:MAG: glycosyltransferase [Flavobacteriaceae bacterium]